MAAPAIAERTRATAGVMPASLKAAAPLELKVVGLEVGAEDVPKVTAGVDEVINGAEVVAAEGVDMLDMVSEEVEEVEDDGVDVVLAAVIEKGPYCA